MFSPQDATANGATPQVPQREISGSWLVLPAALIGAAAVLGPLAWWLVATSGARAAPTASTSSEPAR